MNNLQTLPAEQIAQQFQVESLEERLEMSMPYGRDREQAEPSVPCSE